MGGQTTSSFGCQRKWSMAAKTHLTFWVPDPPSEAPAGAPKSPSKNEYAQHEDDHEMRAHLTPAQWCAGYAVR